ncbi:tripartite tricarboxylate transporter TctB family protein [bacterium LRH843]|nr:tripartite tricarboxylate transporter TctB family protein [bacterium LRH843]
MIRKYSDVYAGMIFLILSIVMFSATLNMKRLTDSVVGSEFAPRLVAGGIFILSVILVINGIKRARGGQITEEKSNDEFDDAGEILGEVNYKKVVIAILYFTIYVALMKPIGFLLMTAIYLFATMLLLSSPTQRKIPLFLIISVVTSVAVYYIFKDLFYLILPAGILG